MSSEVNAYDDLNVDQKISLIYALLICNSVKIPTNLENTQAILATLKRKLLAKKAELGQDVSAELDLPDNKNNDNNSIAAATSIDNSSNPNISSNIAFWNSQNAGAATTTATNNATEQINALDTNLSTLNANIDKIDQNFSAFDKNLSVDNAQIETKLKELSNLDVSNLSSNPDEIVDFKLAKSKLEAYFKSKLTA